MKNFKNDQKLLNKRIAMYEELCENKLSPKDEKELKKLFDDIPHMDEEAKKAYKQEILKSSLEEKIVRTKMLIMDWYFKYNGNVYLSFSGGKDSTVLAHLVHSMFPDVPLCFANTGLEYPEIVKFVKQHDNVVILKPKMSFKQVLEKYGFPVVSKEQSQYIMQLQNSAKLYGETNGKRGSLKTIDTRWNGNKHGQGKISNKWKFLVNAPFKITDECCKIFKKNPFKDYEKETGRKGFVGVMAGESSQRLVYYLKGECNAYNAKRPISKPMFFWNEADVWKYLRDFDVPYSSIYDPIVEGVEPYERTGCVFCMFGTQFDQHGNTRFHKMKKTHPKLYDYCMDKLGLRAVLKFWLKRDLEKD